MQTTTGSITRVNTSAGDPAWLVSGYEEIRELLGDARLGRSHPDPEHASHYSNAAISGRPRGNAATEAADHQRTRRALTPSFSAARMRRLRPRIEAMVAELFDALAEQPRPADFHEAVSSPLPAMVICELLGVPFADWARFRAWSQQSADMTDRAKATEGLTSLREYVRGLIAVKRGSPGVDLVSDLITWAEGKKFSDDEIIGLSADLLFAGNETTVTAIDRGVVLLLTHPRQRELLGRDHSLASGAAEEVLRMLGSADPKAVGGVPRYANASIQFGGVTIERGDLIVLKATQANYDEVVFPRAEQFDITRRYNPHLTFGHGRYFCLGASLARIELEAVFGRLFGRFPALQLAVPADQLRRRSDLLTGGLAEVPVTW
jgi:cytochrome P450